MTISYKKHIISLILITFYFIKVFSIDINSIRFTQCDVNGMLPSRTVYCINQDKNGIIWIGTNSGLSKYDGYNVESFFERDNSISNDIILNIYPDSKNRLWILTDNGINRYSYDTNSFISYLSDYKTPTRINDFIEINNKLLIGTSIGLFYYDEKNDCFEKLIIDGLSVNEGINGLSKIDENKLCLSTYRNIYYYNFINNSLTDKTKDIIGNRSNIYIHRTGIDKQKRIWVNLSNYTLMVYDDKIKSGTYLKDSDGNYIKEFKTLESDIDHYIWIGSDDGIHIFNEDLGLERHILRNIYDDTNISDNCIYSIYKDLSGNIWVGTYFGGLNQYLYFSDNFKTYSFGYTDNHLSGKAVRQILETNDNTLLIATEDGGLNVMKNNKIKNPEIIKNGKKVNNIHSLYKDSRDNIWLGSFGEGLIIYEGKDKSDLDIDLKEKHIFSIKEDYSGNLWIGTTGGLYVKEKNKLSFSRMPDYAELLNKRFCYSIFPNESKLWVGTFLDGIYLIDNDKKICRKLDSGDEEIRAVYFIEKIGNEIWNATNNGIFVFDENGDFIRRYSIESGLSSNETKAIVEDNNGLVWISTNKGLCSIDINKNRIENYTEKDGLPVNQFNFSSVYKAKNNSLYFGTCNGMISFDPNNISGSFQKFPIHITSFNANGNIIKGDFSKIRDITLSYNDARSIFIEFSGMNFKYLNNTVYKFNLDGMQNEWIELGNSHQLQLYNLKPGEHKLCIVAGTENNWNDEESINLKILIKPPFWQTWQAYTIYVLIILIILYFIYKYLRFRIAIITELKAEKQNLRNVEEMNRKRTNFFSYISHDLRTPLSLIISPLQQLSDNFEIDNESGRKVSIALNNAKKINNLIDQLLLFSKFEDNRARISIACEDITQTLLDVISGFEILSKEKNIDFRSKINITNKYVWYSSTALERILYNLLSNAFKFTSESGIVYLTIDEHHTDNNDYITIEVKDTGRGMSEDFISTIFENYYQLNSRDEKSGYGLGLPLVRNLVNQHKGEINVKSKEGRGSCFTVTLNVTESAFSDNQFYLKQKTTEEDKMIYFDDCNVVKERTNINDINHEYKILIVEDNIELNNYLNDILSVNYIVDVAYDGIEGYEKSCNGDYDLILSDVMMPKMDGNEFASKIKGNVLTSHILVLLLSAKIEPDAKTEGLENGADAYLSKPFNPNDLLKMISNLLNTRNSIINKYKIADNTPVIKLGTNKKDEEFLNKLESLILNNIKEESFGIDEICSVIGISRSLLYLKLKKLTNSSATEFIRTIKMKEAKKHLSQGSNVSEASYLVGIYDPNYFTKCFKKQFGISPSEFIKEITVS